MKKEVKVTYRGWCGHYILGTRCLFRLNTLLECGRRRWIVSTVGNLVSFDMMRGLRTCDPETIDGLNNYFETMVFKAHKDGRYWEVDVTKQIPITRKLDVKDDLLAQEVHEEIVARVRQQLEKGERIR